MPTLDELGKKVKAKYPGQYDDMSDLDVGRRVREKYPNAYGDFKGTGVVEVANADGSIKHNVPGNLKSHYEKLGFLPTAGAVIGGFAGGGPITKKLGIPNPVAAAGAGVGAGLGEIAREGAHLAMSGFSPSANAAIPEHAVLKQAGGAVASELAGQQIARGMGWVGKKAGQYAMKAAPEVVQTAIQHGINATTGGLKKAERVINELAQNVRKVAAKGAAEGVKINVQRAVVDPVRQEFAKAIQDSGVDVVERMAHLDDLLARISRDNPGDWTPLQALDFKKTQDNIAKSIFKSRGAGNRVMPYVDDFEKQVRLAVANQARGALNSMPQTVSTRFGEMTAQQLNKHQGDLIEVRRAVQKVTRPASSFGAQAVSHGIRVGAGGAVGAASGLASGDYNTTSLAQRAALGAGIGAAALNPLSLSLAARLANSQAVQRGVPASLQLLRGALQE